MMISSDETGTATSARRRGSGSQGLRPEWELLVPISVELATIRQLCVIDIVDDPVYSGLEPQVLEQPDGTSGLVLLAYRHDDKVELYADGGVDVDATGYGGLGQGLTDIHRTPFRPGRYEVTTSGLQVDIGFHASNGRRIALHLHEHLRRGRDAFGALAPVGGAFTNPEFFPFLWLPSLSFVPVRGTETRVRIDGEDRSIARLPVPLGGRRCLMARYDPSLMVCQVNPEWVTDVTRVSPDGSSGAPVEVAIAEVDGRPAVSVVSVRRGQHRCAVRLHPPLPQLRRLPVGATVEGEIMLEADGVTQLRGLYRIDRRRDRIDLVIDRFGPWRSRQRRPLLAVLFRIPTFRRWPTTYRWEAALELTDQPTLRSRWLRKVEEPR
jgi:hypothetical protein